MLGSAGRMHAFRLSRAQQPFCMYMKVLGCMVRTIQGFEVGKILCIEVFFLTGWLMYLYRLDLLLFAFLFLFFLFIEVKWMKEIFCEEFQRRESCSVTKLQINLFYSVSLSYFGADLFFPPLSSYLFQYINPLTLSSYNFYARKAWIPKVLHT